MAKIFSIRRRFELALAAGMVLLLVSAGSAQVIDRGIETEGRIARDAAQAQAQINQVADETDEIVTQYRLLLGQIESLTIYNDLLEDTVDDQQTEIDNINNQLENLEETNRDVVPLMIEMAETLPRLVQADVPFRLEERLSSANTLINALDDSNITTSEKFRRILEAYQTEIELGRTTEGYRDQLPSGQRVDFLRVGRTLLFYQTLDGSETGWWNPNSRQFERLGDQYRLPVSDGLAIAQNQVAPDLVRLPVPAPTEAD